jgi:Abortive infection bacteriophage resistance protein
MPKSPFNKPPLSSEELVALLQERGLIIPDIGRAERHLRTVGYYRLMGYGKSFCDPVSAQFFPCTEYETVWLVYKFDRKLRLLTLDAVERLEVAIRTALSNELSMAHGSHWFMNAALFRTPEYCTAFCSSLKKELPSGRNEITKHYFGKYDFPDLPPSWMTMECISMGTWVKALGNLSHAEQKRVAASFGINNVSLVSWTQALLWTRNVCAHHGVLWNRINTKPPKTPPPNMSYPSFAGKGNTYYATAVITYGLLKLIVTKSTWAERLMALFDEFPHVDIAKMGFPHNWHEHPFWK